MVERKRKTIISQKDDDFFSIRIDQKSSPILIIPNSVQLKVLQDVTILCLREFRITNPFKALTLIAY
ncbi:MAG: hypothetical protein H7296_03410 [Bacteroidia bacterium]|nr:hypothetical protein [Bacteroidia bacterium]